MQALTVPAWLEQAAGALLIATALLDVFLTVMYARVGTGILSPGLARITWEGFRALPKVVGTYGYGALRFCGPVILIEFVLFWAFLLAFGAALIVHPALGTAVRASAGQSARDLITAFYVGGSSMSIVGASDYSPQTSGFKLVFLFDSLVGLSILSLTLTYLTQVYNALRSRNNAGLQVHYQTAETGDAAELIARWGPQGDFSGGYTDLSALAAEMASVKESHHFYPVLFYFRFPEPYYSVSRMALVSLDAVALIASGLDDERYAGLKESAALAELRRACLTLVKTLSRTFLPSARPAPGGSSDPVVRDAWRDRYARALQRFRAAGIATRADEQAGADEYVRLRAEWDRDIRVLAPAMAYDMDDVDPAGRQALADRTKATRPT